MPKSKFVDFKAVKAVVTMEQVLEHYGLLDKFKRGADSLSGPCPIHKGSNPTQFRVSISKNIWNCFSECKHGGNTLDFIARMKGHLIVTHGTMDTCLVHPREVFRAAVVSSAAALILMHNHPSNDPTPSEADIKVTRDLIRAGQLLHIEVLDHVIVGNPKHNSLRELGHFYN